MKMKIILIKFKLTLLQPKKTYVHLVWALWHLHSKCHMHVYCVLLYFLRISPSVFSVKNVFVTDDFNLHLNFGRIDNETMMQNSVNSTELD